MYQRPYSSIDFNSPMEYYEREKKKRGFWIKVGEARQNIKNY